MEEGRIKKLKIKKKTASAAKVVTGLFRSKQTHRSAKKKKEKKNSRKQASTELQRWVAIP